MSEHNRVAELLPLYAAGALEGEERTGVELHLAGCADCQEDLELWKAARAEINSADRAVRAPSGLAERALRLARKPDRGAVGARLRWAGILLRSQARLVQREIWPASTAVMGLGFAAAVIAERGGFIYALAPLVAAACVALIYGPENDQAYELSLSTPTSPRQILLARLALVFGYNLGLVLVATLGLLPLQGQPLISSLVLSWLAPMTFLSAAALLLSLWLGATNAISITYAAWLGQLLVDPLRSPQATLALPPAMLDAMAAYQSFWQTPALLLGLAAGFLAAAVWLAGRTGRGSLTVA